MSTNILFPLLIVALSLFVAFTVYSKTKQRPQPKIFRLQIPKKRKARLRETDVSASTQEGHETHEGNDLAKWHKTHESTVLTFFELADKIMSQSHSEEIDNDSILQRLPNLNEASTSHPAPDIGAELATLVGIVNTGCFSFSRNDMETFTEQKLLYYDYRALWLPRIRQYVYDFERLTHLRKLLP